MEANNTFLKVRRYIANTYGYNEDHLIPATSLVTDLEIYGDDIDQFFYDFCQTFDIPFSTVDLSNFHTGHEPFDLLGWMSSLWKKERRPITLADLSKLVTYKSLV